MNKAITSEETQKLEEFIEALIKDKYSANFREPVDHVGLGLTDYLTIVKQPMDLSTIENKLDSGRYSSVDEVLSDVKLISSNCKDYNQEGSLIYKSAERFEKIVSKFYEKYFSTDNTNSQTTKKTKNENAKSDKKNPRAKKNDSEIKVKEEDVKIEVAPVTQKETPVTKVQPIHEVAVPIAKNNIKENVNKQSNSVEVNKVEKTQNSDSDDDENSIYIRSIDRESLSERVKKLANDGLASVVRLIEKECPDSLSDVDGDKLMIKLTKIDKKTYDQINQETNQENLGIKRSVKRGGDNII